MKNGCNSSASPYKERKIVLARIFLSLYGLRERQIMSKGSCEAAKSAAGAALRMVRLNGNKWVSSLACSQMTEGKQSDIMVEGQFLTQAKLCMTQEGEEICFWAAI